MQTRIGLAPQVVVREQEDLKESREVFFAEFCRLCRQSRTLFGGRGDQIGFRAANARDHKIAKMADGFAAEVLQVLAIANEAMHEAEHALGGLRGDGFDEFIENAFGDDAEKFAHLRVGDVVIGIRDGLSEQGEAVAKAAFGGARENRDGASFDFQVFGFGDSLDLAGNFLKGESAKWKKLRARFDRLDEIFRAGGGEDEDDTFGRLFESFQQRVRSFVGELMRFVENDDLVLARSGRVAHHLAKLANLIDAAVRGGVDFKNVERSAGGNLAAGIARVVRLGGGAFLAVQSFGEDAEP